MYSKFPLSMENIPRPRGAGCCSLKGAAVVTALIVILFSLLAVAQGFAELLVLAPALHSGDLDGMLVYFLVVCAIIVHAVTFLLSAIMLLGALRDKAELVKPWVVWTSLQLVAAVMLFVFWNTMAMINNYQDTTLLLCVVEFLTILIRFYMLTLVSSFYKQLCEERAETERLRDLIHCETWASYTEA